MNGFFKTSSAILTLLGGLAIFTGCSASRPSVQERYGNAVDLCWPERYSAVASKNVNQAFAGQVNNGKVLDQTIYADLFEPGTANLTPAGFAKLDIISKRRPSPASKIYLQTAPDVVFDPTDPNSYILKRSDLNNQRKDVILAYMSARVAGRSVPFDVEIHDPPDVGMPSNLPITGDINYTNKIMQDRGNAFEGRLSTLGAGGTP